MERVDYLIVGAGISGLAFANFLDRAAGSYLIVERDDEIGGWCKTVKRDGFVWDYSGHFFHFRHRDIEQYLRDRMPPDEVATVVRDSRVHFRGVEIDFPFQKNIHQLPQQDFVDCLYDLYFRREQSAATEALTEGSFKRMLYEKFGRGIAERFLIPYNEKLYACDLEELDSEAMGRFFPHADLDEIMRNMRRPDNRSYNSTFTYPRGGAIEYVRALASEVPQDRLLLSTALQRVDLSHKIAHLQGGRPIAYDHLISSAPFDRLLQMCGLEAAPGTFTSNKVLVFNLGFDAKGPTGIHWLYVPERDYVFYRVGFYDNILDGDRMSLYIEIGLPSQADVDAEAALPQVLEDLGRIGVLGGQKLVAWHSVVLDPAYVHITEASRRAFSELGATLALRGVHSIGRYGGWTYCSIEDNIIEARALARRFNRLPHSSVA